MLSTAAVGCLSAPIRSTIRRDYNRAFMQRNVIKIVIVLSEVQNVFQECVVGKVRADITDGNVI